MANVRALVGYDLGTPLDPVQKILAERGLSIHLCASWEDAELAYSLLEVKYVFADAAMCHGQNWEQFVKLPRMRGANANLIVFNPKLPTSLHHLLGCQSNAATLEPFVAEAAD